ncbi:hypothetical protein [Desulfogranum marinum]|nr:hypothetical protein [Desulfogranum marinum]
MLINRNDILPLIFEQEHASILSIWVAFIEDSLKVFAEVFFVVGFFAILQKSKEAMEENPVG